MRPTEHHMFWANDSLNLFDPVIPANVYAVDVDTGITKIGDGTKKWSELTSTSSTMIGSKAIQTSRDPYNNEMLLFCNTEDKWIFRLLGCAYTETECIGLSSTVFENFTHIIEVDDSTAVPTGRFKICDGIHQFGSLPWLGRDFNPDDFEAGESIEFDGSSFLPVVYLKPSELQSAETPTGKFHRDDGTWAVPSNFTGLTEVESETGKFETVIIGEGDLEEETVSLTSDGTDLFSDGNKVWTEYNDGDGSGLDADTLDGHHSTAFATGPVSATEGNLVAFGASPNILVDSEVDPTTVATTTYVDETFPTVPSTTVVGNIVTFNSTDGLEIADSGSSVSDFAEASHTHTESDISDLKTYVVYHGSSSDPPSTPSAGDEYYDTDDSKFYKYNGTDWIALN